jgi:D-serine deaminase-like pyridoxal phosphate-dependent protein
MSSLRHLLAAIREPTLLLDTERVHRNIERMMTRARRAGVRLRPHFKTHQSVTVGAWFREAGVEGITVSSLRMAADFAAAGWRDITVAFPLNPRTMNQVNALASRIRLGVLVDSQAQVAALPAGLAPPLRIWLKIDVGFGRAGLPWDHPERVLELARTVAACPRSELAGLLTHAGHAYRAAGPEEVLRVHGESLARMRSLRDAMVQAGLPPPAVSVGDTPTCSLAGTFPGADEIRPGNFVFYDLMQRRLGVCQEEDIALALACPVVGLYPERGEAVVHGGAVHLSKESLPGEEGEPIFGYLASLEGGSFGRVDRRAPVTRLSQEHGVLRLPAERLRSLTLGQAVCILPVHACLTAEQHAGYLSLDGRVLSRLERHAPEVPGCESRREGRE